MSEYQSASCNIGSAEVHQRFKVAIGGAIVYVAFSIALLIGLVSDSWRFWIVVPAIVTSIGYVQGRKKFCLAYGFMGVFNFDTVGNPTKIKDPIALAADRKYALSVLLQGVGLALVISAPVLLIPIP